MNESGLYSLIFGSKLEFRVFTKGVPKPPKALHTRVDKEDKQKPSDLEGVSQNRVHLRLGVTQNGVHLNLQSGCLFINESGLYSLILQSKLWHLSSW